ncbi:hypothetical protein, partial [Streptococcus pneumoniae]|uniref:hypothetical protein n=1 Tax=Streptococcus pneumoniae TaxID=1313 RepID=UPI000A69B3E6
GTDYATATTTTITPTKDLPKGKVYVKTIYMPDNQAEKVESDKSDDVTAKLNELSAKGSIQTLAGSGNTYQSNVSTKWSSIDRHNRSIHHSKCIQLRSKSRCE